jgi:DNA-binding NarL/FixJ family response regulator
MIRILLVDDHAAFRQPLAFMLEREPDLTVIGEAASLAEARRQVTKADVVIVDLVLPDGHGAELITEVMAAHPTTMVLVLSASHDAREQARAVEAGAAGVLHKAASLAEVVAAVRRLGAGTPLLTPREVIALLRSADREPTATLTPRERDVLGALAEGLTDKEIAGRLGLSAETVRTHMVKILAKLGVHSRVQALLVALRQGLVTLR